MTSTSAQTTTIVTLAVLATTAVLAAAPVHAHDWRNEIVDSREAEQEARIRAGRRAGELTWFEAQKLRQEQRRIARLQREALADDGRIDRAEFQRINRAQNESARHIREEREDAQRPWWRKLSGL